MDVLTALDLHVGSSTMSPDGSLNVIGRMTPPTSLPPALVTSRRKSRSTISNFNQLA